MIGFQKKAKEPSKSFKTFSQNLKSYNVCGVFSMASFGKKSEIISVCPDLPTRVSMHISVPVVMIVIALSMI